MDRFETLSEFVDSQNDKILEIGALDRPLFDPCRFRVSFMDRLDSQGIREAYAHDPAVQTDQIVPIDHVWNGGRFIDALPDGKQFDVIVACHVFEHLSNPIQWIEDAHTLLSEDGRLLLVVPDKRFTFDRIRNISKIADWMDCYLRDVNRPSGGQVFDYYANGVEITPADGWAFGADHTFPLKHNLAIALKMARLAEQRGQYIDAHCSVFTPYTLLSLFQELEVLNLFPFALEAFYPTAQEEEEFALVLRKALKKKPADWDIIAQQLARQAGYSGGFGGGKFRLALDQDPELLARFEERQRSWREENAQSPLSKFMINQSL